MSAAGSTRTGGTRRLLWWGLPALVVVLLVVGYLVWPRTDPGRVLWVGSFDAGAIPPGRNGSDCHTGRDVPTPPRTRGYDSIQEQGNTDCSATCR